MEKCVIDMQLALRPKINNFEKIVKIVLIISILIWPIFFLGKGIDFTDTGYIAAKYQYFFQDPSSISGARTFVSDFLGAIIFSLVPFAQMMVLSIAYWLAYVAIAWLIYDMFKDFVPQILLLVGILGCSLLTRVLVVIINYNTFSILLLCVALWFLYRAFKTGKTGFLLASGVICGVNTFTRLPNILFVLVLVAIVWMGIQKKDTVRKVCKDVFAFAAGVIVALCILAAAAVAVFGVDFIFSEFSMIQNAGVQQGSAHNIMSMAVGFFEDIKAGIVNIGLFGWPLFMVWAIEAVVFSLCKIHMKRFAPLIIVINMGISIFWAFRLATGLYFNSLIIMVIVFSIVCSVAGAIFFRKRNIALSTMAVVNLVICCVFPLGTSNGMLNFTLFLYLPVVMLICLLYCFGAEYLKWLEKEQKEQTSKFTFAARPVHLFTVFLMALVFLLGANRLPEVYRDDPVQFLNTPINSEAYAGMQTSSKRAVLINSIITNLEPYSDKELLTFGSFTIGTLITEMKPFFTTTWPDLDSFGYLKFKDQLERKRQQGILPVILIGQFEGAEYRSQDKYDELMNFIRNNNYEKINQDGLIEGVYDFYVPIGFEK